MKKKLVLFDFDGTITTKDTLLEFIKYYHGTVKFLFGFAVCSPVMVLMVLKVIPNWRAKEIVLTWFFKNENLEKFNAVCSSFAKDIIPGLLRPQALEAIAAHQHAGEEIVVVSASAENWVKPWCDVMNLKCIATKLEVTKNKLTGKISGKNCYGEEKCRRIEAVYKTSDFISLSAYGDSSGDKQMLALANEKFYKPFRSIT